MPEIGSETASVIDPAVDQNDTTPVLAVGSTPPPAPVNRPRRTQARRLRSHAAATGISRPRRMRGLLVTPWFAAGAGFVIAAGLALNSPHTVLTYRPDTTPCVGHCNGSGQASGSMKQGAPGVQIKTASPARTAPAARDRSGSTARHGQTGGRHHPGSPAPSAGPSVGWKVLFEKYGQFSALITIPSGQAAHAWSLQFAIPGTKITKVWGAQWQPSASDGGLATMLGRQQGGGGPQARSGPGPGWPGWRQWRRHHGRWPAGANGFLVVGQGRPGTPVGCVLNHAACHFSAPAG